jgi:major coat protein
MKIVSMKRTKAEKTAREKEMDGGPSWGADDYHHGLRVSLDHEGMNKIGMKETPKPGDEYHIEAHGRVVSARDESREGQKNPDRNVEILLHRMGAEPKGDADDGKSLKDDVRDAADRYDADAKDEPVRGGVKA